jgi:hypothetical protein
MTDEAIMRELRKAVAEQAGDDELWVHPDDGPPSKVSMALRRLHAIVEGNMGLARAMAGAKKGDLSAEEVKQIQDHMAGAITRVIMGEDKPGEN